MKKVILYYSHNSLPIEMEKFFQEKLVEVSHGIPIISVQKNHRTSFSRNFACENLVANFQQNNWESILLQMSIGIERILNGAGNPIVYLAEHDVLYPETYFQYKPKGGKRVLKESEPIFCE